MVCMICNMVLPIQHIYILSGRLVLEPELTVACEAPLDLYRFIVGCRKPHQDHESGLVKYVTDDSLYHSYVR